MFPFMVFQGENLYYVMNYNLLKRNSQRNIGRTRLQDTNFTFFDTLTGEKDLLQTLTHNLYIFRFFVLERLKIVNTGRTK